MSTERETILKSFLFKTPKDTVVTSKYLISLGISHDLQKDMKKMVG